jgi:hypothetical protein
MATITSGKPKYEVVQWQGPPLPRHLWRLEYFDSAHLPILLKANVSEVILIRSKLYREYVLYRCTKFKKSIKAMRRSVRSEEAGIYDTTLSKRSATTNCLAC